MKSPLHLACALLLALTPIAARSATVYYAPPAGTLPAGRYHGLAYNAVLPSGRLVTPEGTSVVTGMNALGLTLTPDGRYAIVSNDSDVGADQHNSLDPTTTGGYSLAVVDTTTMSVTSRYRAPNTPYFVGLLAVPDPQAPARTLVLASGGAADVVYALTLDANGTLHPARRPQIQIPPPGGATFANATESGPATLLAAGDGRHGYVVDELGGTVASIDLGTLSVVGVPETCGDFPIGATVAGSRLLVTNEGLMRYGVVPTRQAAPPFVSLVPDTAHASSLALFTANGTALDDPPSLLPMDPTPDGLRIVGGAHPSAVVATPDGNYAYVAMTNVDRIATVDLTGTPHVAGGTELRLFDRGPYGTEPSALALSRDGTRLYVALAGLNAIAVIDARDPLHLHRLGLIPAGWLPTALALGPDDRSLFVLNQKGYGDDGGAVWSTLQRIDLAAVQLANTTRATLAATRVVASTKPALPLAIKNVVVILTEHRTFDSVFGDLAYGPADPSLVQFGAAITPNLHALAQRFALAGNMFADGSDGVASHHQLTSGLATSFTERTAVLGGDETLLGANEDPEDMPRMGSIFDALARHRISFRDYGEFVRVAGYRAGAAEPTPGLGGSYGFDVPAPVTLSGHVDQAYPGWNPNIPDTVRAREFMRDYVALAAKHRVPRFAYVWLPNSATPAAAADNDRALGAIVARLSRLPNWRSTAIFVVADDARFGADHVDGSRTFALVVSPYAKAHYVGMRHLSTASVLKSLDGIFGLPPLSLGDLLANDMSDFFTTTRANARPYTAAPGSP